MESAVHATWKAAAGESFELMFQSNLSESKQWVK